MEDEHIASQVATTTMSPARPNLEERFAGTENFRVTSFSVSFADDTSVVYHMGFLLGPDLSGLLALPDAEYSFAIGIPSDFRQLFNCESTEPSEGPVPLDGKANYKVDFVLKTENPLSQKQRKYLSENIEGFELYILDQDGDAIQYIDDIYQFSLVSSELSNEEIFHL
ncbi:MAG: hypothetical protein LBS17_03900 [Actinomycetes bacterium]|jgi:hypothetical protein|nr:hypothetical protein [Actinomycetes bacterium]